MQETAEKLNAGIQALPDSIEIIPFCEALKKASCHPATSELFVELKKQLSTFPPGNPEYYSCDQAKIIQTLLNIQAAEMTFTKMAKKKKVKCILKVGGVLLGLTIIGTGWYGHEQAKNFKITAIEISGEEIPDALDGVTIVHLSDIHIEEEWGNSMTPELLESMQKGVEESLNDMNIDPKKVITVLTGDVVNKNTKPETLLAHAGALSRFPGEKFFVWGNHDCQNGQIKEMQKIIEKAGFVFLGDIAANEATIQVGEDELVLFGTPSFLKQGDMFTEKFYENLIKTVQEKTAVVVTHNMDGMKPVLDQVDADIFLAGHTHGEQIKILPQTLQRKLVIEWFLGYKSPHVAGLTKINENSWGEVSAGMGAHKIGLLPSMRLGTKPEIPIITFRKEK